LAADRRIPAAAAVLPLLAAFDEHARGPWLGGSCELRKHGACMARFLFPPPICPSKFWSAATGARDPAERSPF
jgi:hypothetical protein